MIMFEREKLQPLKYKVGDKIMGFHKFIGGEMLVGGEVIGVEQSTSYLVDNKYCVKLDGCGEKEWWIDEREAILFKQDIWDKVVKHWNEYEKLSGNAYLEYVRAHKALVGEERSGLDDER